MSTTAITPNMTTTEQPEKSYRVASLFNEAHGAYFLNQVTRQIRSTTDSDLIRENMVQTIKLDACTGAVPAILHGIEVKHGTRRDETASYSVTMQWKPGQIVRVTAFGQDATTLRDIVALATKQRTSAGDKDNPEKMKAEVGEHGRIEKFNMTGIALNPYSNRNSNSGSRNTSNWDRNRITADMAMAVQELEVVYADGYRERVISIPNAVEQGAGGSKVANENPFE
jgi:hypothetical protein